MESCSELIQKFLKIKKNNFDQFKIMDDNLDEIVAMAKQAKDWGANISFSSYSVINLIMITILSKKKPKG